MTSPSEAREDSRRPKLIWAHLCELYTKYGRFPFDKEFVALPPPRPYSCYKDSLVNNLEKIRIFFYPIYSYFVWRRGEYIPISSIFLYHIFLYRKYTVYLFKCRITTTLVSFHVQGSQLRVKVRGRWHPIGVYDFNRGRGPPEKSDWWGGQSCLLGFPFTLAAHRCT